MSTPLSILQKYWQHERFRPLQEEIITSVLHGTDTLALLPTGGGKSICFQVPGLLREGLCLVISPLIALMQDQVEGLRQKGIPAVALHGGLTFYEVKKILYLASEGQYDFLYLSPERLESALFKDYLPSLTIGLLVVDEAHCVSQWGYDFRPPYLRIAALRQELPGVPLIAVTASATPSVLEDITDKLKMTGVQVFRQSFARANISYSSFCVDSRINKVVTILENVQGSSIIYCNNRKQTRELALALRARNITADFYHAGLPQPTRDEKQQAWLNDTVRVIVCTNAFGMGIDKAGVRNVIHFDIPDCLENYYQEAGRAGRDGKKAYAVLVYQNENLSALDEIPNRRFPSIPDIKKVYQSLADYLQVPVGTGESGYYDFDLAAFIRNFKLDSLLVINTLKILEQEGHLSFSETIFLPSQIVFTATREILHAFEEAHPLLEPLIKAILRTYQGIFDNRVSVFESQLARISKQDATITRNQLLQLQSFGIIEYLPQKDTPQIRFLLNRAPAQYLHIDQDNYLRRKKLFTERVANMKRYAVLQEECRSRYIAHYFGDSAAADCGICDNCLARKRKTISNEEFCSIEDSIRQQISITRGVDEILVHLKSFSKEKIWAVLEFLQSEGVLVIDEQGMIKSTGK